ncbi:copper amine oxidase family protein [Schinkia azotoformans MEV2011]|uniref:Copper amine oxidase family protein n=1 Tax=Schinkia azotoformans MEV2011 TaxID=1348973 RepID=A0A072NIU7_SCHAZ|nr:copper amine oxidase N-terminal domain-containing protein [Schinkia azotoformans]KEF37167.1 copper amine oxidase family protein [Schinkia azotoformans MEV2011]MEC1695444.1 copper amine oxidase N-terminal domain-containing protein [Schinkia azotoformans]MEC1725724.1 copper amine oxidase N-terminal domain-containing protein [Schinkia azotoformans]MEC1741783.1 copper amine oxidase N-terminal domain-containing protein [Schinkia azotoformans]MEC1746054.1 copper amine oxidase N-terminal domain-co
MKKKLGIIGLSALLSISTVQATSAAGLWSEDLWRDENPTTPTTPGSTTTDWSTNLDWGQSNVQNNDQGSPYTDLWSEGLWEDEKPSTSPQLTPGSTSTTTNEQNNQGTPYTDLWSEGLWKEPEKKETESKPNQSNPSTKQDIWTNPSYVEQWSEPEYVEVWTNVVTTDQWANLVKTPEWSKAVETGQWADVVKTKEMQALQQTKSWDSLLDVQPIAWMDLESILEMPPGEVSFDTPPIVEDGRTFVPLRTILDLTGAEMDWNNSTQTVTAKKGNITIALTIGSKTAYVNNKPVTLDAPAKNKDGRTLVPLRFVSEQLGYKVNYDSAASKVTINDKWHFSTDPKTYTNKKTTPKTNTLNSNSNSNDLIYGGLNDAQWNAMKIFEKYGASGGFGLNYWGQSGF